MSLGHEGGGGGGSGILGLREERRAPLYTTDSVCLSAHSPARNPNALCSGSLPSEPPLQSGACLSSMVTFNVYTWVLVLPYSSCSSLMLGGCPWEGLQ